MAENWFILLMILGTIAFCENTYNNVVLQPTCPLECSDKQCAGNCTQFPLKPEERDENTTNANATLLCRDVTFIVLAHNSGTFVVEHRSSRGDKWGRAIQSNGSTVTLHHLLADTSYQIRFRRVSEDGVSRPEIAGWFDTMRYEHEPLKVPSIQQPRIELEADNPLLLRTEISFTPAEGVCPIGVGLDECSFHPSQYIPRIREAMTEVAWKLIITVADRSCFYDVVCTNRSNHNILNTLIKPVEFVTTFVNLAFEAEYTVMITARTRRRIVSDKAMTTFTTPACLDVHENLTRCPPATVKGLNAAATRKVGNIFDVNVTWDMSKFIPDLYEIWLNTIDADTEDLIKGNVSGTITSTIFSNVKIIERFNVHIRAWSPGGRGLMIRKLFKILDRTIEAAESPIHPNVAIIVITFLASVILVVGTGVLAYHRHGKQSQKRLKYFQDLEEKDAVLVTIKGIEDPDLVTIEESLPLPSDECKISPDRLEIKRILGSGAFGVVKLGSLHDDRGQFTSVAVKMLRDDLNEEDLRSFEIEIKMMKSVGQHPNIVSFLGYCTIGPRPLLIVEYCSQGDLQSFLRAILEKATVSVVETGKRCESNPRSPGCNGILEDDSVESLSISSSSGDDVYVSSFVTNRAYDLTRDAFCDNGTVTFTDLLNFSRQIATGMEFLSSNRVVHRDLAARNVLVCDDRTVKISDFGLSRDVYQENVYKKQGNGRVPVKWMAIEALTHQVYSTYSDVWSYGILLWEIVTLGSSPYPDIPANGVLKRLRSGYRMERPANCSVPLYNVMLSCWQTKPKDRPTFTILRQELDKLLCLAAENEYLDLNDVTRGILPEDEDSQVPKSRYTYFPLQPRYVNDHETHIIHWNEQ